MTRAVNTPSSPVNLKNALPWCDSPSFFPQPKDAESELLVVQYQCVSFGDAPQSSNVQVSIRFQPTDVPFDLTTLEEPLKVVSQL